MFDTELLDDDGEVLRVRAIETRTGLAQTHRIRRDLFESRRSTAASSACTRRWSSWRACRRSRSRSATSASDALSFEALRDAVLEVARSAASTCSASRAWAR